MTEIASAAQRLRHVFVRDLVLLASIGVYPAEYAARQRIRINIDLGVLEGHTDGTLGSVLDYDQVLGAARSLAGTGHIVLVETLAEQIAHACLADPRVRLVRVRVEKLEVAADAASVGVEVERMA